MAQICYYFEAVSQLPVEQQDKAVFSIPSGNFGNLTAGILAKLLGLPIKRFIAATNSNDTVPRFLQTGKWEPNATVATMSNAMDVSQPNNWPRIQAMVDKGWISSSLLEGEAVDEEYTQVAMRKLAALGYVSEPHAAISYRCLSKSLAADEVGIFLGTAHPAKFRETVENVLGQQISLPEALATSSAKDAFTVDVENSYQALKEHMFKILK
jgi:threonine synthase